MVRQLAVVLLVALLLAPGAAAMRAKVQLIQDKTVEGEESIDRGNYVVTGNISIAAGGILRIRDATFEFAQQSPGIYLAPGGTLDVANTRFIASAGQAGARGAFRLVAEAGSTLLMSESEMSGGQGVVIRSNESEFQNNTVSHNEVGVLLDHVNITMRDNTFVDNVVAVNATGGEPKLFFNEFRNGIYCVRDWRSDPDIRFNDFDSCIWGIWHEESNSTLSFNTLRDRHDPDGVAITILRSKAPEVIGNVISAWGRGIVVIESGGFIEDNVIYDNVYEAIHVVSQNDTLTLVNNTIELNGASGILLDGVEDVPVRANRLRDNGGSGLLVQNGTRLAIEGNDVESNGEHGVALVAVSDSAVESNRFVGNDAAGVFVGSASPRAYVANNTLSGSHMRGLEAHGSDGTFFANDVSGATHTGVYVTGARVLLEGGAIRDGRVGLHVAFAHDLVARGFAATSNEETGILLEGASGARFDRVGANGNRDGWVFRATDDVVLSYAKALGNVDDGLRHEEGEPPVSTYGHYEGNGGYGVHNLASTTMDATNSYWGSSTGPTHPLNPGGTGDRVSNGVLFVPFLTSPPA